MLHDLLSHREEIYNQIRGILSYQIGGLCVSGSVNISDSPEKKPAKLEIIGVADQGDHLANLADLFFGWRKEFCGGIFIIFGGNGNHSIYLK